METFAPCCFRLEATRGPHSGFSLRFCWLQDSESSLPVQVLAIGRRKKCWLRLPSDLEVSGVHAELQLTEGEDDRVQVLLRDLKSTNGSRLNGEALTPNQNYPLTDGDLMVVGRTSLRFVKVLHQDQCGGETKATAVKPEPQEKPLEALNDAEIAVDRQPVVTSVSSNVEAAALATANDVAVVDHQDTELVREEMAVKVVIDSNSNCATMREDKVVSASTRLTTVAVNEGCAKYSVAANSPEVATCTVCNMVFGKLDIQEQQAHLNACLGDRAVTNQTAVLADEVKPKTRKRGNAAGATTRAKKPRKPKQNEAAVALTKPAKKPRKRKRPDAGEDIQVALALAPSSTLSKEEQTNLQLAAAAKKLEQLDEQLARLAKRRVNLVKSMERLEKTREKLRRSQVLPPAQVLKLLDLKAALCAIFPNRQQQTRPMDRSGKEQSKYSPSVRKRYVLASGQKNGNPTECENASECDEKARAELALVATISMWSRASQQPFGLQRSTLLYRNSVLRAFLNDDDDYASDFASDEKAVQVDEREPEAESVPVSIGVDSVQGVDGVAGVNSARPDCISDDLGVPDIVKRVFPEWRRDLAFLQDQTPDELELALEAMSDVLECGVESTGSNGTVEGAHCAEVESRQTDLLGAVAYREGQRVACEYMAQIMTQLIADKKATKAVAAQQTVVDLATSSDEAEGRDPVATDPLEEGSKLPLSPTRSQTPIGGHEPIRLSSSTC